MGLISSLKKAFNKPHKRSPWPKPRNSWHPAPP